MYPLIPAKGSFIISVRTLLVLSVDNLLGVNFTILCNEAFAAYLYSQSTTDDSPVAINYKNVSELLGFFYIYPNLFACCVLFMCDIYLV